ncbi:MAG TPA: N-acetylmuramoyl-L-alanine amidase [Mariprofundaceae bacterium]|nr:N-acetylmuramoyl-L-alanine amidase [Mariprofundaceae bacterium]
MTIAVLWLAAAGMQAAQAATIKDVRLWTAPDNSRLVFDLDHSIDYELFRLHNPERIVVDMHRARLGTSMDGLALPDPVIQAIRHGSPKPDVLRMVIDVKEQVQPRSFLLKPMQGKPYRLVIDLLRPDKQAEEQSPITAQSTSREVVIAIDPGHGGEDPGAIGPYGLKEKNVTLAVAKALAKDIDARPGMRAFLTRTGDYFVPLRKRVRLAVEAHADLFISIHANSAHDRSVEGASVYMLSEKKASDKVAQILADKENASDSIGGVMPQEVDDPVVNEILVDLKKRESLNSAQILAKDILQDLGRIGPIKYPEAKSARFMVLTEPRMPSVLVELDFISNPRRERLLADPGYRQRLAQALSQASTSFLEQEGRLARQSAPQASNRTYVVKPGDSLWDISRRYNVPVADIRQTNHLDSSQLRVGQELTLPDSDS